MKTITTHLPQPIIDLINSSSLTEKERSIAIGIIRTLEIKTVKQDVNDISRIKPEPLSAQSLIDRFGLSTEVVNKRTANYTKPLNWLVESGILKTTRSFSRGSARTFFLNLNLYSSLSLSIILYTHYSSIKTKGKSGKRLSSKGKPGITNGGSKQNKGNSIDLLKDANRRIKECFSEENFAYAAAFSYVNTFPESNPLEVLKKAYRLNKLQDCKDKQFYAKRTITDGRVHSTASSFPKDLWQFSKFFDSNTDVVNAQLILSIILYTHYSSIKGIVNSSLSEDMVEFARITKEGVLYETVERECNLSSRKEAKGAIFTVLFSKVELNSPVKRKLTELFPTIMGMIDEIKRDTCYQQVAVALQNIESDIFIDQIYRRLIKEGFKVLTAHDALRYNSKDVDSVIKVIVEVLSQYFNKFTLSNNGIKTTYNMVSVSEIKPLKIKLDYAPKKEVGVETKVNTKRIIPTLTKEVSKKIIQKLKAKEKRKLKKEKFKKDMVEKKTTIRERFLAVCKKRVQVKESKQNEVTNGVTIKSLLSPITTQEPLESHISLVNLDKEIRIRFKSEEEWFEEIKKSKAEFEREYNKQNNITI